MNRTKIINGTAECGVTEIDQVGRCYCEGWTSKIINSDRVVMQCYFRRDGRIWWKW